MKEEAPPKRKQNTKKNAPPKTRKDNEKQKRKPEDAREES
jgi:hypothetical protein